MRFALFSLLAEAGSTRGGRRRPNSDAMEDLGKSSEVLQGIPTRLPTRKEAADSGATLEEAAKMPWFPTHATLCAGRPCRPGEGNLRGYKMWVQPYIHREAFVQSRLRRWPHTPDPEHYAHLVRQARVVQRDNLVVLAAADYDFREIVLNWARHLERAGVRQHLVLSMDSELHVELQRRGIASVDHSSHLDAWNVTCLQRHIQRVRMERHVATAALIAAGLDVLLTDATVVVLRDPLPVLRAPPLADLDIIAQREAGPAAAVRKVGVGVNSGFMLVRSRRREPIARLYADVVRRGLVEFYNRWNNVADALGWSFVVADAAVELRPTSRPTSEQPRPRTSPIANETTLATLREGLRFGFLPHDRFPRLGSWAHHRSHGALLYHLVADGTLGAWYETPDGVVPFRGHRQRLDRYDATDFDAHRKMMRQLGLWLVGNSER